MSSESKPQVAPRNKAVNSTVGRIAGAVDGDEERKRVDPKQCVQPISDAEQQLWKEYAANCRRKINTIG